MKAPTCSSQGVVKLTWLREKNRSEKMQPRSRATCRISTISIACSPKSKKRKTGSTSCSPTPGSRDTRRSGQSLKIFRFDLRHKRQRRPVHGSEIASVAARWRIDHLECVDRRQQRLVVE